MFDAQLEMSFGQAARFGSARRRGQNRAQWWFQRMRQIVEHATNWEPTPPARPVQIWFPATASGTVGERVPIGSAQRPDERQICE